MIRDRSSYLQMLKTSVALDGDLIAGPFCAFLGLQIVLARKISHQFLLNYKYVTPLKMLQIPC